MLAEISFIPMDVGVSLSKHVAEVLDIIDRSGLSYKTGPMGTIVEGDWDEVMELIKKCHYRLLEVSPRVYTRIVIDDRKGATGRLEGKIASVEEHLKRKLKK